MAIGANKVRISVLETTKPESVLSKLADLITVMGSIKETEQFNYFFFFVVDILKTQSTAIVAIRQEKKLAEKAFNLVFLADFLVLPSIVCRKKRIIPTLETVISV